MATYTGNNHACHRHKRFTDNDRDQQTYGSDRSGSGNDRKRTQFFFSNVKTINAAVKTHAAVPKKLTINFFWPKGKFIKFLICQLLHYCKLKIEIKPFKNGSKICKIYYGVRTVNELML